MNKKHIFLLLLFTFVAMYFGDYILNSISKDNFIEIETIKNFENVKNGIIYFGRPSCPYCKEIEPIIRDIAREEKIKIYYFNSEYIRNQEKIEKEALAEYLLKYNVEEVPSIIVLRNGIVIENLNDSLDNKNGLSIKQNIINALISYKDMSNEYIPYYTISKISFIFSLFFLVYSITIKACEKSVKYTCFFLILLNIVMFFINIRSWMYSVLYIEKIGYSGDETSVVISILSLIIFIISSVILVIQNKNHKNQGKKN